VLGSSLIIFRRIVIEHPAENRRSMLGKHPKPHDQLLVKSPRRPFCLEGAPHPGSDAISKKSPVITGSSDLRNMPLAATEMP
jgi:hypothetical protein